MTPLDYLRAISEPHHRAQLDGAYIVWQTARYADTSVAWWPEHGVILWQTGTVQPDARSALLGMRQAPHVALADGNVWRHPGADPRPLAALVAALPVWCRP